MSNKHIFASGSGSCMIPGLRKLIGGGGGLIVY